MEKKLNFTKEHQERLDVLLLKFLKSGDVIKGTFNANSNTVYDLLHKCAIDTLKALRDRLKSDIRKLTDNDDEWSLSDNDTKILKNKEDWYAMINLLLGYRRYNDQQEELRITVTNKREEIARLKLENMTPAERIAQLELDLKNLETQLQ